MFNKLIKQIGKKQFFNQPYNILYCRSIGINNYGFMVNDDENSNRMNLWFFSDSFEKILDEYKKENNINDINNNTIEHVFYMYKENLSDLGWLYVGNY
jgi:hypothetical protein